MLATDADLDKLRFPLLASAKLDGVRAIVQNGVVLSRSLKPLPNRLVQTTLSHLEYLDGELIVGDPRSKTVYRDTVSHVMSQEKVDYDLRFYVFDHVKNPAERYQNRLVQVNKRTKSNCIVITHPQHVVTCRDTLLELEQKMLDQGYEGLILRDPDAPYKYGRSTMKEGYLLKLKRFVDAEFEVIGFEERMHNGNEATTNELGRTKRSSHKENKTGRGDLGALVVRDAQGLVFNVGTGFDDVQRATIWADQNAYLGRLAKVKYFAVGMKDAPRHPVFLGWRDRSDT
jgi:DNA ligase-1